MQQEQAHVPVLTEGRCGELERPAGTKLDAAVAAQELMGLQLIGLRQKFSAVLGTHQKNISQKKKKRKNRKKKGKKKETLIFVIRKGENECLRVLNAGTCSREP